MVHKRYKSKSRKRIPARQRGGTYKPAEYHGGNSGRYTASPAGLTSGAYGTQVAVSQGVLHGDVAGPNLSWSGGNTMTGGGSCGGSGKQTGGTYKPAEYHGGDSGRYTASPAGLATGAYGTQVAVSQGVLHGDVAGPNLSWSSGNTMTGGGTGGGKRTHRRRKSANKTRKQKAGGCGCAGGTNKKAW